jgi:hypothetical protein
MLSIGVTARASAQVAAGGLAVLDACSGALNCQASLEFGDSP